MFQQHIPIVKYLDIKFFVDNSAKSSMLCFVHNSISTLTNWLQVCQFTVWYLWYFFLSMQVISVRCQCPKSDKLWNTSVSLSRPNNGIRGPYVCILINNINDNTITTTAAAIAEDCYAAYDIKLQSQKRNL